MSLSETTVRRGLYGMLAGGLLAFGAAVVTGPMADAQPAGADPAPPPVAVASTEAHTIETL